MSNHIELIDENFKELQIQSQENDEQDSDIKCEYPEHENKKDSLKCLESNNKSSRLSQEDFGINCDLDFRNKQNKDSSTTDCQSQNKNCQWKKKTCEQLLESSLKELYKLKDDLSCIVEGVSAELVTVLQERHDLQEEVDLRNIAIEQLLKVQEKFQWRSTEPFTVQMSVILPEEKSDILRCN